MGRDCGTNNSVSGTDLLAVMCKYPSPGHVKTRLGQSIGMDAAAKIAKALLRDLISTHCSQSYCLLIEASPQDKPHRKAFQELIGSIPLHIGSGAKLRGPESQLWAMFRTHLQRFSKVVALYADVPLVGPSLIRRAFQILDWFDVVIGPDLGDGYYLIGMAEPHDLFTPLPSDRTPYRSRTIELAQSLGLSHTLLDPRADLDCLEDMEAIQLKNKNLEWSRTMETLRHLGL